MEGTTSAICVWLADGALLHEIAVRSLVLDDEWQTQAAELVNQYGRFPDRVICVYKDTGEVVWADDFAYLLVKMKKAGR